VSISSGEEPPTDFLEGVRTSLSWRLLKNRSRNFFNALKPQGREHVL
jgi:hypothetical protein